MQWRVVVELAGADGEAWRQGGMSAAAPRLFSGDAGSAAGRGEADSGSTPTSCRSRRGRGVLPGAASLPALCSADATEGPAMPTPEVPCFGVGERVRPLG